MCKIKVSAEFRREIPPRNSRFRGEISRRNTAKKVYLSLRIKSIDRRFAVFRGEKDDSHYFFLLFKYNFKLDVFISVQVVSIYASITFQVAYIYFVFFSILYNYRILFVY